MGVSGQSILVPLAVKIPVDRGQLDGELEVPSEAKGLVIFAHGSGSSRLSPRNIAVARRLQAHSFATLLVDLLTEEEDGDSRNRFDIKLLTDRLAIATDWAHHNKLVEHLPVGYFGASTGAAAALRAALAADEVGAVVSRGGRVDLAEDALEKIDVPTLLIVGQNDYGVLEANEEAFLRLRSKKELAVIPRASHLFEESGALDRVAQLAAGWFNEYLGADDGPSSNRRDRSGN